MHNTTKRASRNHLDLDKPTSLFFPVYDLACATLFFIFLQSFSDWIKAFDPPLAGVDGVLKDVPPWHPERPGPFSRDRESDSLFYVSTIYFRSLTTGHQAA